MTGQMAPQFPIAIQVVIGGVLIALGLLSYALEWYRRK